MYLLFATNKQIAINVSTLGNKKMRQRQQLVFVHFSIALLFVFFSLPAFLFVLSLLQ